MLKATRQQTKEHNTSLVLRTIYQAGSISRAGVARATLLTRTTVSDIVSELAAAGLVEEIGPGEPTGGKPPILLHVRDDARQLIAIDLSNDEFTGAVVDLRGRIVRRVQLTADTLKDEAVIDSLYRLIDALIGAASAPLLGIGIGTPGLVDVDAGVVRRAVNLGWTDVPLKHLLTARYGLPIHVANDSHVAALAESTFSGVDPTCNLVVIKAGRGIGSGIVLAGRPYYGDGFGAGEIGHLKVSDNGEVCTCGNTGCLETVASTRALLHKAGAGSGLAAWDGLVAAARAGDATAAALAREAGRYLGVSIANLTGILNIHKVILTGSLADFGEVLLQAAREELGRRVLSSMAVDTEISLSQLGSDNILIGASALVLAQELGLP